MTGETGNRILNRLEQTFGKLAIPHILKWIVGFQVLSWFLESLSPGTMQLLDFDRSKIMSGEVWRVFSWVLIPISHRVIFVLITAMFMFFISSAIEEAWDSFRTNLYVFSTILLISLFSLLFLPDPMGAVRSYFFYTAMFLAFAALYPDHTVHLFFVIPIKAKWLGWANIAAMVAFVLGSSHVILATGAVLSSLLPFLVVFIPRFFTNYRREAHATQRRNRHLEATQTGESFHECEVCGATDLTHPDRDFRVTSDHQELCHICLEQRK